MKINYAKFTGIARSVATLLAYMLLLTGPARTQSLATVGESDALAVSMGYASSFNAQGPTLSFGISGGKSFELSGQIARLENESKPVSVAVAIFPQSGKQSGGFAVVGDISIDLEDRRKEPVLSFGGLVFVNEESSTSYVSGGVGFFDSRSLGSHRISNSFMTFSFGVEIGSFSEERATPFISLSAAAADGGGGTAVALSLGFRLPISTKKKVKATLGLPSQFD